MSKESKNHYHWVMIVFNIFLFLVLVYLHFRVNDLEAATTQPALSQPVESPYPGAHFECMAYENRTSLKVIPSFLTHNCGPVINDYCKNLVKQELNCNSARGCSDSEYFDRNDKCFDDYSRIIGQNAGKINWDNIPIDLTTKLFFSGCITILTIENITNQVCTEEVLVRNANLLNSSISSMNSLKIIRID